MSVAGVVMQLIAICVCQFVVL